MHFVMHGTLQHVCIYLLCERTQGLLLDLPLRFQTAVSPQEQKYIILIQNIIIQFPLVT